MADDIQDPSVTPPKKKKARFWVSVLSILVGVWALCFIGILALLGSNSGTAWLLKKIASQQHVLTYQYVRGNFQNGVILDDVKVELESTDITAKRIKVRIGWRSILQGQVHLIHTTVDDLGIFVKTPPTGKPFHYPPIRLPFTLRVNDGTVNGLTIKQIIHDPLTHQLVPRVDIIFNQIHLQKAIWKSDLLTLENSSVTNVGFAADHVTGTMQFSGHYPIRATAQATIPPLHTIGSPLFQVQASGDLEEIHGVISAMKTQGMLNGNVVVRPMDHIFFLKGQVHWRDLHWPIITGQKFYSRSGFATVQSTQHGLDIQANTDLVGENVPAGQYVAQLFTNYKNLDIQSFQGKAAHGTVSGSGEVDWQKEVTWLVQGQFAGVDVAHVLPTSVLPYAPYLPKTLTGPFRQTGLISPNDSQIGVNLTSSTGEHWLVGIARLGSLANNALPLVVDAQWENMNRMLAGVGQVNTQRGEALLSMHQGHIAVDANLDMLPSQHLPAGHYEASLTSQAHELKIPSLTFTGDAGAFNASASVDFASPAANKKPAKPMTWTAEVSSQGLDIHSILESPIQKLQGSVQATGISTAAQQSIVIQPALTGLLKAGTSQANASSTSSINLTGRGQVILTMNTAKNTHGLKTYLAKFDGDLKSSDAPSGKLNIQVSGTPDLTKIERFEHDGVAGQISATGQIVTKNGMQWSASGKLNHFNLGFFLPAYPSSLTGSFNTTGQWNDTIRHAQIAQLDLTGALKKQPLIAKGMLDVVFNPKSVSPLPDRLTATNFILDWAGNRITANGGTSTSANGAPKGSFNLQVDAKNLGQISPEMDGRVSGTVDLTGKTLSPDIQVNLNAENFRYSTLTVKNANLTGRIPQLGLQPSQLILAVNDFRHGKQIVTSINAKITGTQQSHVLDISARTPKTQFNVELAGGLDSKMNWVGEIRKGMLVGRNMALTQEKPAALQYLNQTGTITVAPHCWSGAGRFCITDPLVASAAVGHVALTLDELDLSGFHDMMPNGMIWSGKLQGKAVASWQSNSLLQVNAEISTDNGFIGLDADDPQDPPSTLPYQRLSLVVTTQASGIKLRFDAKTPNIGTGYIDALIESKAEGKTISGALVLDHVQLQVLKPFFPGIRELSGIASLAGGMSGPLTNPAFYGNLKLNDGKVVATSAPLNLHDINFTSSIRGTQATLDGQFMSGDGTGTLTGLANWVSDPVINLKLAGKELAVRQLPILNAVVSPALDIQILPIQKQVTISGRVDVPHGVVSTAANTSNAISKSSDVRIVNLDQATTAAVLQNVRAWMINADINLVMGNDLRFRGFGANARINGGLQISQHGTGGLMATGQISLEPNAKVDAYGQELILSKSNIIFKGPLLQPQLNIEADKVIDNRTVGIVIQGSASNPKISTWNNAGLTDQETYSAILSGYISTTTTMPTTTINNTALVHADVDNALAAAGISAGLSGSHNFTNELGSAVGLSNLTFGADGSDGDTKVNVTGYLSPDLYIRYGVGVFTPVNKLTLRYQMSQRFYMEASSSIERAIDFFYSWRF